MLVVSDLDDVFVPLRDGLFAFPQHSRYAREVRRNKALLNHVIDGPSLQYCRALGRASPRQQMRHWAPF